MASSWEKLSTLTLAHKRSHVMEVPRIGFLSKTQTPNKHVLYSQSQNNILFKSHPFPELNE